MRRAKATLRRALTSAAKFWVCKRGCELAAEAMEILGGNGYTEELSLARIVREMPVNSIWEGSGNIMCLDVLRAFGKSPATTEVVLRELSTARGQNRYFDAAFERFAAFPPTACSEALARRFAQIFVTLMQAQLLLGAAGGSCRRARRRGGVLRDALESRCGLGCGIRRGQRAVGCRRAARPRLQGIGLRAEDSTGINTSGSSSARPRRSTHRPPSPPWQPCRKAR